MKEPLRRATWQPGPVEAEAPSIGWTPALLLLLLVIVALIVVAAGLLLHMAGYRHAVPAPQVTNVQLVTK